MDFKEQLQEIIFCFIKRTTYNVRGSARSDCT